jgi:hypothetical protein
MKRGIVFAIVAVLLSWGPGKPAQPSCEARSRRNPAPGNSPPFSACKRRSHSLSCCNACISAALPPSDRSKPLYERDAPSCPNETRLHRSAVSPLWIARPAPAASSAPRLQRRLAAERSQRLVRRAVDQEQDVLFHRSHQCAAVAVFLSHDRSHYTMCCGRIIRRFHTT